MEPIDCHDLYWDGRHYDSQHRDYVADIPFYLDQVSRWGDPVLELGCGTGRVTIPIAKRGYRITGLDASEPMLAEAGRKAAVEGLEIEWVLADCRDFSLDSAYRLVIFPFNSIGHLHSLESIRLCFSCVRRHLEEGGRFIVEFFNPLLAILTRHPEERHPVARYDDPDGSGEVVITESNEYDRATQVNRIRWHYEIGSQPERIVENNVRIFFPQELDALVRWSGFRIDSKFGDYDGTPFESNSRKQLVVCTADR